MTRDSSCPECGASQRRGTCKEQLRRALLDALPEGSAAHLLALACFTLQHPAAQGEEALSWARFHLEGTLAPPLGAGAMRARASSHIEAMSSPLSPHPPGVPLHVVWRVTVADLPSLAEQGLERAHAWAHATLDSLRSAEGA